MSFLKGLGELFLDSIEDSARRSSKSKILPEELKQQHAEFASKLQGLRNGEVYNTEDEDY